MLNGKNGFISGAYVRNTEPGTSSILDAVTTLRDRLASSERTHRLLRLLSRDYTSGFDRTIRAYTGYVLRQYSLKEGTVALKSIVQIKGHTCSTNTPRNQTTTPTVNALVPLNP
jgi:hypothetical protein